MEEIWKTIHGYPNYEASNLGRIKSLNYNHTGNSGILKPNIGRRGYYKVVLFNECGCSTKLVHQLIAIAFLGHIPNGYKQVVNHINFNILDNNVDNLEIISQRRNANRAHIPSSSKYVGVVWNKQFNRWRSLIVVDRKTILLGTFISEIEASEYYNDALLDISNGDQIKIKKRDTTSIFTGVTWDKHRSKWCSYITIHKNIIRLGRFDNELDAYSARQNKLKELNLLK